MRYIVIPEPQTVIINGTSVSYGLSQLNAEFVWTSPVWRENETHSELFHSSWNKFAGRKPGDVVGLTDEEFEIYSRLATLRGQVLQNPGVVVELMTLMRAVLRSTSEPPLAAVREQ